MRFWPFRGKGGGGKPPAKPLVPAAPPGIKIDPLPKGAQIWENAVNLTGQLLSQGVVSDASRHPVSHRIVFEVPGLDEAKRKQIAALFDKHCPQMVKITIVPGTDRLQLEPFGKNHFHYGSFVAAIQSMH